MNWGHPSGSSRGSHYGVGKVSASRDISVLFDFFKYKSYISLKFPQDRLQWVQIFCVFNFIYFLHLQILTHVLFRLGILDINVFWMFIIWKVLFSPWIMTYRFADCVSLGWPLQTFRSWSIFQSFHWEISCYFPEFTICIFLKQFSFCIYFFNNNISWTLFPSGFLYLLFCVLLEFVGM